MSKESRGATKTRLLRTIEELKSELESYVVTAPGNRRVSDTLAEIEDMTDVMEYLKEVVYGYYD